VLEKWLREHNPEALDAVSPAAGIGRTLWVQQIKKWGIAAALAILLGVALFLIPFPYTVGGEAEIAPMERHFAFSRIEGLIAAVNVREGGHVRKGDVLCSIDPKDLDFRIGIVKRELETLTREAAILVDGAGARPAQLARAEIVELNRRKKSKELEYLVNQRAHVQVTAPVDGVVVTKGVEAATGKRLAQGEPFCEVAALTELGAEVHVPDDRITRVKPGQTVSVYLNSDPSKAHTLRVFEISPKAEPFARLGNIFRVKARVEGDSEFGMSGMKGIGKIDTGTACLWTMLNDRLKARWNGFTGALM
jgi:multidrug efflux pump subunit AcrA (membrane-fusion protein)